MRQRLIRPIRAVCVVLAASACAAPPEEPRSETTTREVLQDSYRKLSSYHIDPINLKVLSLDGLKRLQQIDSSLDFVHGRDTVSLLANEVTAGNWPAPRSDDLEGWTDLVTDALHAARAVSPEIATRSDAALSETVLGGVMSSFDRYTRYAGPGRARRQRALREGFGGLGIAIRSDGGVVSIRQVIADTPASRAGLRVADRITRIDGKPVAGMGEDDVTALLRGPVGAPVRLEIARKAGARTLIVDIARARIIVPTVTARRREDLLIIALTGFNQGTAGSIGEALAGARRDPGLAGVVIDLRNNPGGLLDQAVAVADLFLADGRVISTVGRHPESFQIFDATSDQAAGALPVVLLINGKSASASEIVAAALHDRGRALVIGSTSYGKGTVQTVLRLPNDGELTVTWARMVAPSGFTIQDRGVIPGICTSAEGGSALLGALHRGDDARRAVIALQRRVREAGRRGPDHARAACPPRIERPAADMAVARFVLRDRRLYARALAGGRQVIAGSAGVGAARP